MNTLLQEYEEKGLVYSQRHPTLPLTIYNYTDKVQWENLWDEVTLRTRGLVVDINVGEVVARPFEKFFNLSEGKTTLSDTYEIFEKYDGSLGILFQYKGEWVFASRGSFTSEQACIGKDILDKQCDYTKLDKNNTYCFEIIYRTNRIVVDYGELETVILTGVINTKTGEELSLDIWGLPYVNSLPMKTPLAELHLKIKDNEEGYVVKFSNGERCKIKGGEYLRLHKAMTMMSTTAIWECLRNNESILKLLTDFPDEWFNVVKEYEEKLKQQFKNEKIRINSEFKVINLSLGKCDDKVFASFIKNNPYKSYLFSLRNNKNIDKQIWKNLKPIFRKL